MISVVPVGIKMPEKTLEWLQAYARKHNRPMIYYERLKEGENYVGLKRFGYGPAKFRQKSRLGESLTCLSQKPENSSQESESEI